MDVGRPRARHIPAVFAKRASGAIYYASLTGGFRNRQADDSQPEHACGCVRQAERGTGNGRLTRLILLISRRGPWAVVLAAADGQQERALMQCQAHTEGPIPSEDPWDHQDCGRIKHGQAASQQLG